MTTAQATRLPLEHDRVVRWRTEELIRAGYSRSSARVVASQLTIDLHDAAELVRKGCPVETALRILL